MQAFAKPTLTAVSVMTLFCLAGCQSDAPPGKVVEPAGAIVTPVPEVNEFLEVPDLAGCGFRYSGAPIALSLEIYLQTIPQSDWNDDEKRKQIVRSKQEEEDRKFDWNSIQPDLIDSYESGAMSAEEAELIVAGPTGIVYFAIPDQWFADTRPGYVGILGQGSVSAGQSFRFPLSQEFRDIDQSTSHFQGSSKPQTPAEPIAIGYGETAQLAYISQNVYFGDGPDEQTPVYRIVAKLTARCLRPPTSQR
jgi:hypothetical protein